MKLWHRIALGLGLWLALALVGILWGGAWTTLLEGCWAAPGEWSRAARGLFGCWLLGSAWVCVAIDEIIGGDGQ